MNLKSAVFAATFSTSVISLMTSYDNADSDVIKQPNTDNKSKIKFFKCGVNHRRGLNGSHVK